MNQSRPLAIVIGQGRYNDMGLIRSCGVAGMEVIMIAPDGIIMPIHKSRYVKKWIKSLIGNSDELIRIVNEIIAENPGCQPVIFPASDTAACVIDEAHSHLEHLALIPHASGRMREVMDKAEMVRMAREANLRVPASVSVDLHTTITAPLGFPCIIKPLRSIAGDKGDITVCHTQAQYDSASAKYKDKGFFNAIVQEYISGADQEEIAITGVSLGNGNIITDGIIHKKRIRGNGSTVFANYQPGLPEDLRAQVAHFLKLAGYRGIFDMEFLVNTTGRYFIECNFRNGAYGYAITSAGFNMPDVFLKGLTGISLPAITTRRVTFMEERSDFLNVLDHTISLRQWLCDLIKTDTFLWWNLKDPGPLLRIPHFIKRFF